MTVAGQGQAPGGQLPGQRPRRPSTKRAILGWRNWSLSVKLAAVTLVPIIFAMVLGGITINNQIQRSGNYQRIDRLVTLGADVRALVGALRQERTETVTLLTQGTVGTSPALDLARAAVDKATAPLGTDGARAIELDPGVSGPDIAAGNALARLSDVRQQVGAGQLDAVQALDNYSAMVSALLALDTSLVGAIGDGTIGGSPSALHDLQVAVEEMSTSQALLGYGISRHNLAPAQLNELRMAEVRLAVALDDFRAAATPDQQHDFDATVTGADYDTRGRLAGGVLATPGPSASQALGAVPADQWSAVSNSVIAAANSVSARLGDQARTASTALVESASTDAGLLAVLLFLALVVTAAVVFLITRQLLRSLRVLRTSALDVADHQLPEAVRNIQEGRDQGVTIRPLAIGTTDEIGQVAQAFDAVHSQALRLAAQQAELRTGYNSVFVNLSRRSQSLVQRQLHLIERLERDEEDADQLATLFQLDHLATRMRRNNENLMVLSGAEAGRRSGQPVAITDVLRAASSEIEQYQRVVVQQAPDVRIVGYAANDVMRLTAELLDNATAFSAPETQVSVTTRISDSGGLVIDIVDQGIGMNEAEVAEANARLTEAASVDLATSRRMGLFVVGRLAGRHNIGVSLYGGRDIVGVRATVTVPADLVMGVPASAPAPSRPESEPEHEEQPAGGLPRRRTVNGAARSGALTSLAGTSGTRSDGAVAPGGWMHNGHAGVLPARTSPEVVAGSGLFSPVRPVESDLPPAPPAPSLPPAPPAPSLPPGTPESPVTRDPAGSPGGPLPAGKALFEANTTGVPADWANPVEPYMPALSSVPRETTPIFDETLSAWFRSDRPEHDEAEPGGPAEIAEIAEIEGRLGIDEPAVVEAPAGSGEPAGTGQRAGADEPVEPERSRGWAFAADESWRTVQSVSQVEPTSYTEAGLPRRRRGEQLMPGSAAGRTDGGALFPGRQRDLPVRDPAEVRGRLSSFQHGVHRARHAAKEPSAPAPQPAAEPSASEPQPAVEPTPAPESQQPVAGPGEPHVPADAPSLPQPTPVGGTDRSQPVGGQPLPRRRPRPVASRETPSAPVASFGQLPRRQPASTDSTAFTPVGHRDATEPEATTESSPSRRDSPAAEPVKDAGQLPRRGAEPASPPAESRSPRQEPEPASPQGPAEVPEPATPAAPSHEPAWSFDTDESWRTVETASQAVPSSYTAAGLPRRRRGEQLMPGTARTASGPRPQRDPQDVRGRLSSFQQGVRRGRHQNTQQVDTERETMEGE